MALLKGQTLDLNTLEVIEAPKPEAETPNPAEVKDEVKDEPADDPDADKPGDAPAEEGDKPEDTPADEPEAEKKEEEGEEKKEVELDLEVVDDYLAQQYEEKYGIANEEDLVNTLEAIKEVEKENADLRQQLEEAKANTTPKFENEQEQKAFEFLKRYPISKMGDGMATYARLVTLDVETVSPRVALEEKFIIEHDELTREEALHKFNRDFDRKYKVKAGSFDSQEEADSEQKNLDIDLKSDAAKAKKFLAKQQEEFKSKITDKPATQESAQTNALIQQSVKTNLSELDEYIGELETLSFDAEDGSSAFNYKFTKQQKELIRTSLKGWIGNPNSYEANGKFRGEYNVEDHAIKAAAMLFYEDMIEKALVAGQSQGEIKRADQIAQRKPNREAKAVSNGKAIPIKEEEQWEALAKSRKNKPVDKVYK